YSHSAYIFNLTFNNSIFLDLTSHFFPVEEFVPGDLDTVREIVEIIADAERRGELLPFYRKVGFIVSSVRCVPEPS
ncbi:unnamed protein product, partial [Hymenolepis diminuta]